MAELLDIEAIKGLKDKVAGPVIIQEEIRWKKDPTRHPLMLDVDGDVTIEKYVENINITSIGGSITAKGGVGCLAVLTADKDIKLLQSNPGKRNTISDNASLISKEGDILIQADLIVVSGIKIQAKGDITIKGNLVYPQNYVLKGDRITPATIIAHYGDIVIEGSVQKSRLLAENGSISIAGDVNQQAELVAKQNINIEGDISDDVTLLANVP